MKLTWMAGLLGATACVVNGADDDRMYIPPDAGVVNVIEFGAKPDDGQDDTEAIRSAIKKALSGSRYAAPPFIFFPAGQYDVSDSLEGRIATDGWSSGWRAGFILVGESRTRSVIKLKDACEGFTDPAKPRSLIVTGSEADKANPTGGGNRAFRHSVINLTIDVGDGNPGASGIDYITNNRGSIENVTVRAGANSGFIGIPMLRNWPGPCLIKDVKVIGFARSIELKHYQYGVTFENLTLENPREVGLLFDNNSVWIRGLKYTGAAPAIRITAGSGTLVLNEAELTGRGGETAIESKGFLTLSKLKLTGFAQGVVNLSGTKKGIGPDVTKVDLFTSHPPIPERIDADSTFSIEVKATPTFHSNTPTDWMKVGESRAVLAEENKESAPAPDGTDAIQQAIDSGKPIVYLPNGHYSVSRTLIVRGSVRKIMGFQSSIGSIKGTKVEPLIRFVGGEGESTVIEHFRLNGKIEHAGAGTLAIRHVDHEGYSNTKQGTGDFFAEDVIGKPYLVNHPQSFFGRQVNCEFGDNPLIENHGGSLWILGFKTEGQMTCLKQTAGRTELLGCQFYVLRKADPKTPMFDISGGKFVAAFSHNGNPSHWYQIIVQNPASPLTQGELKQRTGTLIQAGK